MRVCPSRVTGMGVTISAEHQTGLLVDDLGVDVAAGPDAGIGNGQLAAPPRSGSRCDAGTVRFSALVAWEPRASAST